MLFNASIFVETKPKSYFFGLIKSEPIIIKITDLVIEGKDRKEAEIKLSKEVEEYKETFPVFLSDKTITAFLVSVK